MVRRYYRKQGKGSLFFIILAVGVALYVFWNPLKDWFEKDAEVMMPPQVMQMLGMEGDSIKLAKLPELYQQLEGVVKNLREKLENQKALGEEKVATLKAQLAEAEAALATLKRVMNNLQQLGGGGEVSPAPES